jgi:hypothetical protein
MTLSAPHDYDAIAWDRSPWTAAEEQAHERAADEALTRLSLPPPLDPRDVFPADPIAAPVRIVPRTREARTAAPRAEKTAEQSTGGDADLPPEPREVLAAARAALAYWTHQREHAAAPSLNLVKASGVVYARRCGAPLKRPVTQRERLAGKKPRPTKCLGRVRHYSDAQRQFVCGHCGAPWRSWERHSLRGETQETGTRRDGAERRLARFAQVGLALERLRREARNPWAVAVYIKNALGSSFATLAALGPTSLGVEGQPPAWSVTSIKRLVNRGAREWVRQLRRVGFDFGDAQ